MSILDLILTSKESTIARVERVSVERETTLDVSSKYNILNYALFSFSLSCTRFLTRGNTELSPKRILKTFTGLHFTVASPLCRKCAASVLENFTLGKFSLRNLKYRTSLGRNSDVRK